MSGLLKSATLGNGLSLTETYSLDYELSRLEVKNGATPVIDLSYARGDALNLTGITDNVTAGDSQTFGYTPANRLGSAASSGTYGNFTWTYDGVGNRLMQNRTGPVNENQVCTFPATSNRLQQIMVGVATARSFTYDGAGNILNDTRSGILYATTYNHADRLKTVTLSGNLRATYIYNALNQMAVRTLTNMTPSGTTHFVYDRAGNLIAETNGAGVALRECIWLPGGQIAPSMVARAGVDPPVVPAYKPRFPRNPAQYASRFLTSRSKPRSGGS